MFKWRKVRLRCPWGEVPKNSGCVLKPPHLGTSLAAPWLTLRFQCKGALVRSLVRGVLRFHMPLSVAKIK